MDARRIEKVDGVDPGGDGVEARRDFAPEAEPLQRLLRPQELDVVAARVFADVASDAEEDFHLRRTGLRGCGGGGANAAGLRIPPLRQPPRR